MSKRARGPTPAARPRHFQFCGGNRRAYRDHTSAEILLAGPAGTGKTVTNLLKLLKFGSAYPGARMLVLRKTRKSLTESALVTWEHNVLGEGHPVIGNPISRGHRHDYKFPNGSVLVTAGMDNRDKILSSEWDMIYVNEATELEDADWQFLGMRIRAHAGPYDQLIADCNPNSPKHWLYQRCKAGLCTLYPTHHYENPAYYDNTRKQWTEAGRRYVFGRLRQLTGTRRARFLLGKWVAAEGAVYAYDPEVHDLPASWTPPADWKRVWAIDWGDRAPTVLQIWCVDREGRMYLWREVFKCRLRADELGKWAKKEMDLGREPRPYAVVSDVDLEGRIALFEGASGLDCEVADKPDRDRGIQDLQTRFDRAANEDGTLGRPRIFFHPRARGHEPDALLLDEGRPTCTVDELVGYVWDERFVVDKPIEENDHGMDACRYACRWIDEHLPSGGARPYTGPVGVPLLPGHMGELGSSTGW